jgi:hypothetical protein
VFGSSFRPVGPVAEASLPDGAAKFRLDAEDLVIALDAKTGKTLWKAAEPGGLLLSGGKRGGFQVAPAYHRGRVFSLGSTGRLFAYDAATGKRLWTADIGPAHAAAEKHRARVLAAARQGKFVDPDGPGWHTSLIVADGVLVVPTFTSRDSGLRGFDTETGQRLWEAKEAVSRYATPNVWKHGDREYVLCATVSGTLRLLDARDGRERWKVTGLGPNYFTLAPSHTHVLVNCEPFPDPKAQRVPGYYGAFRLGTNGAERVWTMPREPWARIPTGFDSCARQRYALRDGLAYVPTGGTKEAPGRFLLLEEATGNILASHVNSGRETDCLGGLFYLVEDRVIGREDSAHGARHGGRHPFTQWRVQPGTIQRLDDDIGLCALDAAELATAYEVFMETPVVAGRMFERTVNGTVVCYDLREPSGITRWHLQLENGVVGLPPLPVRLWTRPDGSLHAGKAHPPTDRQAGLPYGTARRFAQWERVHSTDLRADGQRLSGTVNIGFGTHTWPVKLDLQCAGGAVSGTSTREIPALEQTMQTEGAVTARGPLQERLFPTPWLTNQPWTSFGPTPAGLQTYVLQLPAAIPLGRKPAALVLSLDHDGRRFVRATAAALGFTQSWHEVDARGLRLEDGRITGTVMVLLNGDWWTQPNVTAKQGVAARIKLEVPMTSESPAGAFTAEIGVPWTVTGMVTGTLNQAKP